jgi:type I restriction enzyme S subunit
MIPQGWEEKTLGEICVIIAGQSPNSQYYNTEGKGLPFYQGKKEFTDKYIGAPSVWTTETTKEALAGDILMSVRAPVGPINFATDRCCIGRGLASIRNGKLIGKDFLFYYLLSIQQEISGHDGAVFSSISRNEISALKLLLPPLPEQERIVAKLDKSFEAIDKVKANAEQNLNNAKELFESTLDKAFTENTEGWEEKTLGEVLTLEYGKGLPQNDRTTNGIYNVYGANGIKAKSNKFLYEKPSIIVGRKGSVGELVIANEAFWALDVCYYTMFDDSKYNIQFLYNMLTRLDLKKLAKGVKPGLNRNEAYALVVKIPNITEQQKIVEKLDALQEQTKQLEQIYTQKIKECDELKQSILQKAFRGEL